MMMKTNYRNHALQAGATLAMLVACMTPISLLANPQVRRDSPDLPAPAQGTWPRINMQHGRYFAFAVPAAWQVTETTNGVDLLNPDRSETISFVGLEGTPGSSSPRQYIEK